MKDDNKLSIFASAAEAYKKGLEDAWECARKLRHPSYGGYYADQKEEIFGYVNSDDVLTKFTAAEVIKKIEDFKEKKDIKVGDEVIGLRENWVVIHVADDGKCLGFDADGLLHALNMDDLRKTGRHIDQINGILDKLKEGPTDDKM